MYAQSRMRQYQQQAVLTSSPEQIIAKLYDLGVTACRTEDRSKLRRVLVELITALNFEKGGELAHRLDALYRFCIEQSGNADLKIVEELLSDLRDVWREVVMKRQAA